jgi:hypothetical protein
MDLLPKMNNPCSENYEKMAPAKDGRFCSTCCKVVVDFTKKTAQEIFEYLKFNTGTCGKFRHSQLQPARISIAQKISSRLKRFSIALYLVFGGLLFSGTACGGEMEYYPNKLSDSLKHDSALRANTLAVKNDSLRKIDSIKKDSTQNHH